MWATPPAPRIALISMPWQDPFSPSIQLGALAGYVKRERPDVVVDTFELFLELADAVGIHLAKRISINRIGEALFSYLLFPGQSTSIAGYLEGSRKDDPAFRDLDFAALIERLRVTLLRRLDAVDWRQYTMVGLSVVFSQMMPSILCAREIKRRAPDVQIVFGGPSCTNQIGKSLLDNFDFIDYIVNGEGERPLISLLGALETAAPNTRVDVRAVVHRDSPVEAFGVVDQVPDMAVLPAPDYDGYFRTLTGVQRVDKVRGRIRVPVETSRGCWWDRSHVDPMLSCSFCNLNLQWHSYREKAGRPVGRGARPARRPSTRPRLHGGRQHPGAYKARRLPSSTRIRALDLGLDLWMEARASAKPEQILRLREVGAARGSSSASRRLAPRPGAR